MKTILRLVLLLSAAPAHAQIFKCTDANGKVNFTDSPCQAAQQAQQIERVPPQGLDKLYIELDQKKEAHKKWEAEHQAQSAELERKERRLYIGRQMHEGLRIGMTSDQVEALPHWRWSEDSNITQTAHGTREQRIFRSSYDNEYERMYLYFNNGILTVIQD